MHYIIVFVDRYSDEDLLSVKFAGVAIGNPENCEKWLEDTILGKRVWFTLLDHTSDGKSLSCVVYAKHTVSHFVVVYIGFFFGQTT